MQTNPVHTRRFARTAGHLEIIRRNLDKSDAGIGRILGLTKQAVNLLRQRYQIAKVHMAIQRQQRMDEQIRRLKPGLSAKAAALQSGISEDRAKKYCKEAGYHLIGWPEARHFHWRKRIKSLPPLLTISAVARKLGVSHSVAALLCFRHKYKVTIPGGWQRPRVPIRRWFRRPHHERWLASLKPAKP